MLGLVICRLRVSQFVVFPRGADIAIGYGPVEAGPRMDLLL